MHVTAGSWTDIDIKMEHTKKIQALIYLSPILWLKDHCDSLKALEESDYEKREHTSQQNYLHSILKPRKKK